MILDRNTIPDDTNMFFVSNYCFTFINESDRKYYQDNLLSKCDHGFLVWQTSFGATIQQSDGILSKTIIKTIEEIPQTGPSHAKNYYVTF